MNWFVQKITTPFHSGWFAYNKQFIEQIPIKIPATAGEKKLGDRIADSVRAIINAKSQLRDGKLSDRERVSLECDVESLERRIDDSFSGFTVSMACRSEQDLRGQNTTASRPGVAVARAVHGPFRGAVIGPAFTPGWGNRDLRRLSGPFTDLLRSRGAGGRPYTGVTGTGDGE